MSAWIGIYLKVGINRKMALRNYIILMDIIGRFPLPFSEE
jgi:hypothetical protein